VRYGSALSTTISIQTENINSAKCTCKGPLQD